MELRLKPIEKPSFIMKLAYQFSKIKFGKVLGPLKVAYARLPLGFSLFANKIGQLEDKLILDTELVYLIRHHVAQINSCNFCMDIGIAIAIRNRHSREKFYRLHDLDDNPIYSDAERAALYMAGELTIDKQISDITFANARKYFSERALVEIAWVVSTEHYYNLLNLAFNIHSDNLCELEKRSSAKAAY